MKKFNVFLKVVRVVLVVLLVLSVGFITLCVHSEVEWRNERNKHFVRYNFQPDTSYYTMILCLKDRPVGELSVDFPGTDDACVFTAKEWTEIGKNTRYNTFIMEYDENGQLLNIGVVRANGEQ